MVALAAAVFVVVPSFLRARSSPGEAGQLGNVRTMDSAQRAYESTAGHYGPPECLKAPRTCLPRYDGPSFLDAGFPVAEDRGGYRYRFHPGGASDPKRLEGWAFTAEALLRNRRSYCADASGAVCATDPSPPRWGGLAGGDPRPPAVAGGRCTACVPLR